MGVLTAKKRANLSPHQFAIPPTKSHPGQFPIQDRAHAANAIARASQGESAGTISKAKAQRVISAAHKKLHGGK